MRRLIIAPHVDDEVIGCSSLLDADTLVYYVGVDDFHEVPTKQRMQEADAVAAATNHTYILGTQPVNNYKILPLIAVFEELINQHQPHMVVLPWPSYNQDHQTVYSAAMVALRPHDRNWRVPSVYLYEEPDCWWPCTTPIFVPNVFVPLDIERKLHLYELMASQVRGHRSPEHLRALAAVRGGAVMLDYAEAFVTVRDVIML